MSSLNQISKKLVSYSAYPILWQLYFWSLSSCIWRRVGYGIVLKWGRTFHRWVQFILFLSIIHLFWLIRYNYRML